jgi:hypothetical protein
MARILRDPGRAGVLNMKSMYVYHNPNATPPSSAWLPQEIRQH